VASRKVNLEKNSYTDPKYNFIISYPKGWTIDTSGKNANVEFDDLLDNEVAIETISVESDVSDLQTYAKNVIKGFEYSSGANSNFKVIAQGNTTLDGQPAYEFEITYNFINNSQSYPFHGIYIISLNLNTGYVFFASSFEQLWDKYRDSFNASVLSFKFSK
jgi:hypothetical protein